MAVVGRIIMLAGWFLILLAAFGPAIGWAVNLGGIFPGIFLLFLGGILRRRAEQRTSVEEVEAPTQPPRPLATQRPPRRQPPPPPPEPVVRHVEPEEAPETESSADLMERILSTGTDSAGDQEVVAEPTVTIDTGEFKPRSSAEMIARARSRWNRTG